MSTPRPSARFLLSLLAMIGATLPCPGCGPRPSPGVGAPVAEDRDAVVPADDPYGEVARSVAYLPQNWSPEDSARFYFTSQGSQILPYDWFLHLEQPDGSTPFRDGRNILRFRYLPQKPGPMNPDGLPVGFVKDQGRGRDWLGLTCAACHTSEVHYRGVAYRVDGAPSLGNMVGLLRSLTAALKATRDQPDKFDRFAGAVLKGRDGEVARKVLAAQLGRIIERREGYDTRNFPPGELAGHGRIDAFGAILNEVFHRALPKVERTSNTANTRPADAPVSLPFLWDTPQSDKLQWNGSAENGGVGNLGALGRNVGEVLGVFGDFEFPDEPGPFGYSSSVQVNNLRLLEEWVRTLWSPRWPDAFPAIDPGQRDKGRALFAAHCRECHHDIDRADPDRRVQAAMVGTGTDPLMADNFAGRVGKAGKLEGSWSGFFPLSGTKIPAETPGALMLKNAVVGTIVGSPFRAPDDELSKLELTPEPAMTTAFAEPGPRYKGRPLNGIWATAPFLHNGSVPSLAALLEPPDRRPKKFSVGRREFDPDAVGFRQDAGGPFVFRVLDDAGAPIPGNSNQGHTFGTDLGRDEKAQLLAYLRSL